ncbi:hypothetical protein TRVL_04926 [Trypanosoma vivax]|nr:hypothetical protein TRVL_04926 [Trypanosoma vivax]
MQQKKPADGSGASLEIETMIMGILFSFSLLLSIISVFNLVIVVLGAVVVLLPVKLIALPNSMSSRTHALKHHTLQKLEPDHKNIHIFTRIRTCVKTGKTKLVCIDVKKRCTSHTPKEVAERGGK